MGCGDVTEPLARMGFGDVTDPLQSICARVGAGVGASALDVCQKFLFPHLVSPHAVFDGQPKFGMEVAPRPVLADGLPYATLPGKGGLVFSRQNPFKAPVQRYRSR